MSGSTADGDGAKKDGNGRATRDRLRESGVGWRKMRMKELTRERDAVLDRAVRLAEAGDDAGADLALEKADKLELRLARHQHMGSFDDLGSSEEEKG